MHEIPPRARYAKPEIQDHGSLSDVTESTTLYVVGQAVRLSVGFAGSILVPPDNPPGPGPGPDGGPGPGPGPPDIPDVPDVPDIPDGPDGPDSPPDGPSGGNGGNGGNGDGGVTTIVDQEPAGGGSGDGGSGGAGGGAGGSGGLPFTGYAVVLVAGIGAALASVGARARRAAGRSDPRD
jgi:hypothetical protein